MSDPCNCQFCNAGEHDYEPDDDEPCFECREFDCVCPPNQCPECGDRCATLCIDDTCRRGPCCCFHEVRR